jgi:uncharacterized surface protein with fasciclin (FAS1) repeats
MYEGFLLLLVPILLMIICIPPVQARQMQNSDQTLVDLIYNNPELAFFTILLEEAELYDDLDNGDIAGHNQLTVFGPTNAAFETVDEELLTYLMVNIQWKTHLANLLGYHIVDDEVVLYLDETAENIVGEEVTLTLSSSDNAIMVNGYAKVIDSLGTLYGVVHVIDTLLNPGWLNKNLVDVLVDNSATLSTFTSLIGRIDTVSTLATSSEPYTLFAPTNAAFDQSGLDLVNNLDSIFVDELLGLHVVPGIYSGGDLTRLSGQPLVTFSGEALVVESDPVLRTTTVNGHLVIESNLLANNGVVHIVNSVLTTEQQTEVDPEVMEKCAFEKEMEERLGVSLGVQCNCSIVGSTVQLLCTEGSGEQQCVPKYGFCNDESEDIQCCSPFQRRCHYSQCRDSTQPERVKIGATYGGATGRLRQDRNNLNKESNSLP